MKHFGLSIAEGSEITNITIPAGTADPSLPNVGELFYRTDLNKLRVHNGTLWEDIATGQISGGTVDNKKLLFFSTF